MIRKWFFGIAIGLGLFIGGVSADVVHDESIDGDLSNDGASPTLLMFNAGNNEILGSTTASPLDLDIWTFEIGSGFRLDSVVLQLYDTTEDQSFFAVQSGDEIALNGSALLGSAAIGRNAGAQQGDDVLDDLGNAGFGGAGFSGPLGPGQYTFWYQENAAPTNYSFGFNVSAVPEPASVLFLGLGFALVGLRRNRNSKSV